MIYIDVVAIKKGPMKSLVSRRRRNGRVVQRGKKQGKEVKRDKEKKEQPKSTPRVNSDHVRPFSSFVQKLFFWFLF